MARPRLSHRLATFLLGTLAFTACPAASFEDFQPLPRSSSTDLAPHWQLPPGFSQQLISDEGRLDIYPGMPDWADMNTFNETGMAAGRFLYRTHEVRPRRDGFSGGAVSVVDLHTGRTQVLAQRPDWEAVDGIVWTPWGSLLINEETGRARLPDPEAPEARHGLVYEIRLQPEAPDRVADIAVRPALGSLAHEGIEVDADGNVYVIDEHARGSIYRFVPDRAGDLSSGTLYALAVESAGSDRTGPASWIALDRDAVRRSARDAAAAAGATPYRRPEDLERIGDTLYVAVTGEHRVLAINLKGTPVVSTFVSSADADTPDATLRQVDNLADGPGDTLWIVEDNKPSDIWVADPDRDGDGRSDRVRLFGSFNDGEAEGTGIYFAPDGHGLFVNLQHTADGNDRTLLIKPLPDAP